MFVKPRENSERERGKSVAALWQWIWSWHPIRSHFHHYKHTTVPKQQGKFSWGFCRTATYQTKNISIFMLLEVCMLPPKGRNEAKMDSGKHLGVAVGLPSHTHTHKHLKRKCLLIFPSISHFHFCYCLSLEFIFLSLNWIL